MSESPPSDGSRAPGLRWIWVVAIVAAALAFAGLRARFTHEYSAVPWARLLAGDAPLPFGHRVLVPWLARPLVDAGVPTGWIFGLVEALSFAAVLGFTAATLRVWVAPARARLAAALLGVALGLVYIVPRTWPLLYPWDGPAVAVLAVATWAGVRQRFALAWCVAVVGALNRETAALVPVVLLALHAHAPAQRSIALGWAQLSLAGVIAVRVAVALGWPDNPGPPLHFTIGGGEYRVFSNLRWLGDPWHWPWLVVYVGVLPLAWPVVWRRVPGPLHRVALVGVADFLASLVVANVYEPRAWGEAVYLTALAATVGLVGRGGVPDPPAARPRWLAGLDRFTLPVLAVGFVGFVVVLRAWAFLPIAQWPMPR